MLDEMLVRELRPYEILGLWCLMPLSTISVILWQSRFIGGGNQRKPFDLPFKGGNLKQKTTHVGFFNFFFVLTGINSNPKAILNMHKPYV